MTVLISLNLIHRRCLLIEPPVARFGARQAAVTITTSVLRRLYSEGWVIFSGSISINDRRAPKDAGSGAKREASYPPLADADNLRNHGDSSTDVLIFFLNGPMLDPRDLTPDAFAALARDLGTHDVAIRRLISACVGRGIHDPTVWGRDFQVPRRLREAIALPLPRLTLERSETSAIDGFQKLLFRTRDGLAIETVLIPLHKPGAVSLCVSSQVGCPMGCVFCATARMARRRNLETWEIIDQFVQAREIVRAGGRRVTGAVFMGMGEPFLNYDRVLAAADLLRCPYGGSIAAQSITISTVGLVPEIDRFTTEGRRFRLAISLGAATDAKRAQLVPLAARTPVADVMAAARRHALARRDRVMLVYVCIGGVNVDESDAVALAELIDDTAVRLDLIDVTDPTGHWHPPAPGEYRRFRDVLARQLRQPVVRRYSGGADIRAACGTLAGT